MSYPLNDGPLLRFILSYYHKCTSRHYNELMAFNLFRKSNNNTPTTPNQPEPKYEGLTFDDSSNPGKMHAKDIFFIKGRGTVIVGKIESGTFREGQTIDIETENGTITTAITSIQTFKKGVDFSAAGDNIGLILANVKQEEVQIGNLITAK